MVTTTALEAELLRLAGSVPDPELPVLTLEDLGVVRAVHLRGADAVEVELTPTYTGCPAVEAMSRDIERVLREHGMREVAVRTVLSPAWSTDDITPEGRRKLRESGIAPPRVRAAGGPVSLALGPTRTRSSHPSGPAGTDPAAGSAVSRAATGPVEPVACPHCGSADTELLSRFSSTACKALRRCRACENPFDHFKEV
ncbi:1,2-phenylacetyl-CoA epoxidase subunit PaaD [Streptomyces thermodiastaticus]|jgi:ring-1,2-phenylacetyl-CoA epoxidase subunit PaaD|uniref:1,2-phenylacetyl-CoA epoxidase subunit PaaD n=1 Tax=Streptomyces thermodiastaticus TaxID=44061 RepID=UPI001678F6CD|nr:1,2-phenylacetyl-CoA epoxidase subunit PaaD [Streptomyces thermodiastaticus]MCE7550422.1 phenylacetate-CoA oxygenase subunit PaaJ [Streptomyces thermodiastaticus]GHF69267.1 phenylacetate-CoA oxygenase subunit PaaJ [Streptomyces thermodiastaticus]